MKDVSKDAELWREKRDEQRKKKKKKEEKLKEREEDEKTARTSLTKTRQEPKEKGLNPRNSKQFFSL